MRSPSGLKAADMTNPVWPARERSSCAGLGIPDFGGVVGTGGDDAVAIGAEGRGPDESSVAGEGEEFLAGLGIPDFGGVVGTGGDDAVAIGTEGGGPDRIRCGRRGRGVPAPVWASQTLAVLSSLAVTMRSPSGLKAADKTDPAWPARVRSSAPVWASQTLAVLSALAVTMRSPSGLKAADKTNRMAGEGEEFWPVWASQTLAVLSSLAVTMRRHRG